MPTEGGVSVAAPERARPPNLRGREPARWPVRRQACPSAPSENRHRILSHWHALTTRDDACILPP